MEVSLLGHCHQRVTWSMQDPSPELEAETEQRPSALQRSDNKQTNK